MPTTAAVPLSRRERERQQHRRAMLDAARAVFAEKGYDNATLDEVAQRAEYGKGTLYNYFPDGKESLLYAILDELYDEIRSHVSAHFHTDARAGRPIRDVFEAWFAAMLAFYDARQDLFKILIKEAHRIVLSEHREKVDYLLRQRESAMRMMIPALEAAIAAGELRPLPSTALAEIIVGNLNGYMMHQCLLEDCGPHDLRSPQEAAAFLTTVLFDGLSAR